MNKYRNVKIEGHYGTWYNITEGREYMINGKLTTVYLFEHEKHGDEVAHVIATKEGELFMQDVWNGWDDWKEYLLDEQGYSHRNSPLIIKEVITV